MAADYIFDTTFEKRILGCVFRDTQLIHEIILKYPVFVDATCREAFEWLKNQIIEENVIDLSSVELILYKKKPKNRALISFLLFLSELIVSPTLFEHAVKHAVEEKARRDLIQSNFNSTKNIAQTSDVSLTLNNHAREIEIIQDSLNNQCVKSEDKKETDLTFPFEVMEGVANDFATIYSDSLEGAREFFYISFLTCLGSIFSDKVALSGELKTQPRLYALLIGQSADARKSTILNKTVDLFKEAMYGFSTCWGINSAEGLGKILKKNENEPLLLVFDEFKSFVNKTKIEGSVLLPMITTFYESNKYEAHTKTKSVNIETAYISILGASTTATYEKMWTANFLDIGFLNRILLIPGDSARKFSIPPKIDPSLKKLIKNSIRDIAKYIDLNKGNNKKFILPISREAREIYHNWYISLQRSEYSKRIDAIALRLMILLSINIQQVKVDADIVKKIITLMDWQLKIRKAYDPIDCENAIARLEENIRRQLLRHNSLKDSKLKQCVHANRTGLWAYNTALKNLIEAKEIKFIKKTWILIKNT